MNNVLVCPVAFNENVKLKSVIERFLNSKMAGKADYLIVDDGSTDGTTEMIATFAARGVQTIKHHKKTGVGAAIRTAIKHASKNGYEVLVIMAGNDKDNPEEIPNLLSPILTQGFEIVQGSRYIGGSRIGGDMPFYRKLATKLHPFLFSLFVGKRVTDSTNGFRAMRLSLFEDERINLDQEWLNEYELEPYILFKAIRLGHRFCEAPVTKIYPAKSLGYTKMKPITGWWSILKPIFYLGFGIRK